MFSLTKSTFIALAIISVNSENTPTVELSKITANPVTVSAEATVAPIEQIQLVAAKTSSSAALKQKVPFEWNKTMESIGIVLMFFLIALSNAGGLSGAGSNIPIMLIFFNLEMNEAVPISAAVAVTATVFRFIINFSQKHPNFPERNSINYEVVQLTMPFVFLGSFYGVIIGKMIGPTAQVVVFGITVAWSIQTTSKKACQLLEKEKKEEQKKKGVIDESSGLIPEDQQNNAIQDQEQLDAEQPGNNDDYEKVDTDHNALENIYYQEKYHFTGQRVRFIFFNFVLLFTNQFIFKNEDLPAWVKNTSVTVFTVMMILMTIYASNQVQAIHEKKIAFGYKYDANDVRFDTSKDVFKLAIFCMIAAMLCGMTGIAGGMVLGPLFLTYNMVPQIMSGTNQYITMIASVSVVFQFIYIGQLYYYYAMIFGAMTIFAAFTGIKLVNIYIKKSGKQSIITILLVIVLTLALVSLPLKYILMGDKTQPATKPATKPTTQSIQAVAAPSILDTTQQLLAESPSLHLSTLLY